MSKWQPIETAPKDGTRVILNDSLHTQIGFYSTALDCGECLGWVNDEGIVSLNPTHWMPLPEPPKED